MDDDDFEEVMIDTSRYYIFLFFFESVPPFAYKHELLTYIGHSQLRTH